MWSQLFVEVLTTRQTSRLFAVIVIVISPPLKHAVPAVSVWKRDTRGFFSETFIRPTLSPIETIDRSRYLDFVFTPYYY